MEDTSVRPTPSEPVVQGEPLLFRRREYLDAISADASTTSCQKTRNPPDYGPDD